MKSVVVVGAARSGTSMTCGALSMLGVNIISAIPQPNQLRHNPKGMFEHINFRGFSVSLTSELKNDIDAGNIPDFDEVAQRHGPNILAVTGKFSKDQDMWGFKAQSIYSIDVLSKVLENCHIVYVSRDVRENAKSFQVFRKVIDGNTTPLEQLEKEITHTNKIISQAIQRCTCPTLSTTYERLRKNTKEEAHRMAEFLEIKWTQAIKKKVLDFVDDNIHTWKESNKGKLIPIDPRENV